MYVTEKVFSSGLDACAQGNDCDHICVNAGVAYICKCRAGYVLNPDKKTCSRKNHYLFVVFSFVS